MMDMAHRDRWEVCVGMLAGWSVCMDEDTDRFYSFTDWFGCGHTSCRQKQTSCIPVGCCMGAWRWMRVWGEAQGGVRCQQVQARTGEDKGN